MVSATSLANDEMRETMPFPRALASHTLTSVQAPTSLSGKDKFHRERVNS